MSHVKQHFKKVLVLFIFFSSQIKNELCSLCTTEGRTEFLSFFKQHEKAHCDLNKEELQA
jgi:hypothetical protein